MFKHLLHCDTRVSILAYKKLVLSVFNQVTTLCCTCHWLQPIHQSGASPGVQREWNLFRLLKEHLAVEGLEVWTVLLAVLEPPTYLLCGVLLPYFLKHSCMLWIWSGVMFLGMVCYFHAIILYWWLFSRGPLSCYFRTGYFKYLEIQRHLTVYYFATEQKMWWIFYLQ